MKELIKKLVQEYVRPVPLLIMALCLYAGYLIALDRGTPIQNFIVMPFVGVIGGTLFSYGYVKKKYQIFLWALLGICIASATAMVQGENRVLITNLFLEVLWGAFVGLLVEQSPRGVAIGALVMGLLFGSIGLWGRASINGVEIENRILAAVSGFFLFAWKGAWFGGMIGASWSNYKKGKQKADSETA